MIPIIDGSYLRCAIEAAIKGAMEILRIYSCEDITVWTKADKSPLTQADINSQDAINSVLQLSGLPIMSEETTAELFEVRKKWSRLWIVDPLDGTKEFVKRNGQFTVNIALVENNKSIMGVILTPVTGDLYVGSAENGSFKAVLPDNWQAAQIDTTINNLNWIKLKNSLSNEKLILVVSSSHFTNQTAHFVSTAKKTFGDVETVSTGSSLKMCMVAAGLAHAYPRFGPTMEWDTAAGHAIIKGMGGNILKYDTLDELEYNRLNLINPWFIAIDDSIPSNDLLKMIKSNSLKL